MSDRMSVWSGLVNMIYNGTMLKIYIYWHKCYFGHGDNNNNRVNLEQVCSLNIEQSRLLQKIGNYELKIAN